MSTNEAMERRASRRHNVWFPIQVDADTRENRLAICHDCSVTGVLLRTPSRFQPGERVKITFRVRKAQHAPVETTGEVVRVNETQTDGFTWWPRLVAIRFDQAIPELESMLEAEERAQAVLH